jgi:hypothetical protein
MAQGIYEELRSVGNFKSLNLLHKKFLEENKTHFSA